MSSLDSFELSPPAWVWPVPRPSLRRVGQSVLQDRDGKGRPHYGLDIFAPVGTPILSAQSGRVVRIVDGRRSAESGKRRAGLWVDCLTDNGLLCRYLHMGEVRLIVNQEIRRGALIGYLGENPSGEPHLHFEIRKRDVIDQHYGDAIDPLIVLPPLARSYNV